MKLPSSLIDVIELNDDEAEMLAAMIVIQHGGAGSGNFGHAGRIGEVGGSQAEVGAPAASKPPSFYDETTPSDNPDDPFDTKDQLFYKSWEGRAVKVTDANPDQKKALRRYSGGDYYNINALHRGTELDADTEQDTGTLWQYSDSLDNYLNDPALFAPESMKVYRGMALDHDSKILEVLDSAYNDQSTTVVFRDAGYLSTSTSKRMAFGYTSLGSKDSSIRFVIDVPKYTKCAPVPYSLHEQEVEVIFPRMAYFNIKHIERSDVNSDGGREYLVWMEAHE